MRWLIEVVDILVADERLFRDLLSKLGITLHVEGSKTYLISNRFDLLSTSDEVWKLARKIRDDFKVCQDFPNASISFQLGDLYEEKDNGARIPYRFLSAVGIGLSISIGRADLTVTPPGNLSEEEIERLEAERLENEYQEKLALVSSRVLSASQDERALKVHRFLQQDLNPSRMYHIYELIKDDLGGNLNSLASRKKWDRFTHSVNHQAVFGDDARHMTSNKTPPANPMSLSEAQAFIARVADLWFRKKCASNASHNIDGKGS